MSRNVDTFVCQMFNFLPGIDSLYEWVHLCGSDTSSPNNEAELETSFAGQYFYCGLSVYCRDLCMFIMEVETTRNHSLPHQI